MVSLGFCARIMKLGMMSPVYREPGLCCSDNMGVTHLACVDSYLFLVQSGTLKSRRISALCSIFTRTVCRRFQPGFCWQVVWNVNAVFHDMPTKPTMHTKTRTGTLLFSFYLDNPLLNPPTAFPTMRPPPQNPSCYERLQLCPSQCGYQL